MVMMSDWEKSVFFVYEFGVVFGGLFGGEVRAPRDDVHTKQASDLCNFLTTVAETYYANGFAFKIQTNTLLPSSSVHGTIFLDDLSG